MQKPAAALMAFILVLSLVTPKAQAEGKLPDLSSSLFRCPFIQTTDPFKFDSVISSLQSLLQTKLEKNSKCRAPINELVSSLDYASKYYSSVDSGTQYDIQNSVYSNWYADLSTELATLNAAGLGSGAEAAELRATLATVESQLAQSTSDAAWSHYSYNETKENEFRIALYNNVNSVLNSLQSTDAECIDVIGGWQTLTPALLGMASLATGFVATGGAAVVGAALALGANLAIVMQDSGVKKAINNLVKLQNDQILACSYYSIKYSACEYKRAYEMSQNTAEIRRFLERDLSSSKNEVYDSLFRTMERVPLFDGIFNQVATMGTPLTMDLGVIINYLDALRISPYTIPEPPVNDETKQQQWLILVSARGISVSTVNPSTHAPVPIAEQVKQVVDFIKQAKSSIAAAEALLAEKRSFEDLRHQLDAKYPGAKQEIEFSNEFIKSMVDSVDRTGASRIPVVKQGALLVIQEILARLNDFVSVRVDVACPPVDPSKPEPSSGDSCYTQQLNKKGTALFEAMARGAIAQVNRQSVLTLGSKSTERLERALQVIDQQFLYEDLQTNPSGEGPFSLYRRDRMAFIGMVRNYEQFTPVAIAFRPEKIQQTLDSFEKGFGKEIRRMVKRSLESRSDLIPEIKGKSAPQLCSLFASSLGKMPAWKNGKHILKECREQAPELDQIDLIAKGKIKIDYNDPCFYMEYDRKMRSQQILLERYMQWDPRR